MKRSPLLFLLLLVFYNQGLMAIEFSSKEKSIIYTNAIKVLDDYQSIVNQMGESVVTNIEKAKSSSESFLELFVNRQVLLYNDLDPAHKLSEFYEAETYSSNIILWYPDGLIINLDLANAKVSEIMSHEENVYSIDIMVTKSINGNYLNQTINKNNEELTFRIAFGVENKSLTNFRIVGIRNASSNIVVDYSKALKEVNSEDFSGEDMNKVHSEIKTVLQDYTNFLSLLGDPQEPAEDKEFYKTSFRKLFQNDETRLFNDITPEPETNLITIPEYLSNFVADFPNGIKNLSINSDSAKFGKIMKAEDGSYYTYTDANKFFSGSYKGKEAFRKMFPLIFKISFKASGKTFTDFRINSVDVSSVNFYEAAAGNQTAQKPEIIIRPVTRKGLGMSLIGSFGQTSINNKNIESLTVEKNLHSWNVSPLYRYISALGLSYYLNDNIAVRTGVEFNRYASKFSLNGKFTDNILLTNVNDISYFRVVEAAYDSLVTINFVTIPILINYTSGKPGKPGFYAEAGTIVSVPASASYSNKGSYKYSGYLPGTSQVMVAPEFGFYTREDIDQTEKIKMKGLNISFYSSAGINIPLGYYSSVSIGPEVIIGLSDIMNSKKTYTDIFGKTYDHQSTKIKNFGIRISLAYKL